MKKWVAVLMILCLMIPVCSVAEKDSSAELPDPDYDRAFAQGYVDPAWKEHDLSEQITSSVYREMLMKMIRDLSPSSIELFEEKVTTYDVPMLRYEAVIMSWYAAVCIHQENSFQMGYNLFDRDPDFWKYDQQRVKMLFPDALRNQKVITEAITYDNELVGAFLWNQWRRSSYSKQKVIPFDREAMSMHSQDAFTFGDAIAAVARLYDSGLYPVNDWYDYYLSLVDPEYSFDLDGYQAWEGKTEEERSLLEAGKHRQDEILNARSEINETGQRYYVSNSGSDQNNGKTPESAWATPQHAMKQTYNPGDYILLERGGEWVLPVSDQWGLASDALYVPKGVTLGAYGEGPKPIIRGDIPTETNDPSFWVSCYDQEGIRIWQSARPLRESNVIVFNEGEAWADEVMPCFDGQSYCDRNGNPFEVASALNRDLTFCCLPELNGDMTDVGNRTVTGPIYLRCDAGNPAEVWKSVSVPQNPCGLSLGELRTAQDLNIRYFTCSGPLLHDFENQGGRLVNSEVSWCGGLLSEYQMNEEGTVAVPYCAGGALQITANHTRVENCYIHDCGPMSFILSVHGNLPDVMEYRIEDIQLTGNLIERCGAIHWADLTLMDYPEKGHGVIADYLFENNMVFFSGLGWVQNLIKENEDGGSLSGMFRSMVENVMGPADNENIVLRDNVFFCANHTLIYLADTKWGNSGTVNAQPTFTGNTYVQTRSHPILYRMEGLVVCYADDINLAADLGDELGKVIVIQY